MKRRSMSEKSTQNLFVSQSKRLNVSGQNNHPAIHRSDHTIQRTYSDHSQRKRDDWERHCHPYIPYRREQTAKCFCVLCASSSFSSSTKQHQEHFGNVPRTFCTWLSRTSRFHPVIFKE